MAEHPSHSVSTVVEKDSTLPAAVMTFGGKTSADVSEGTADVIFPVLGSDEQFLFVNPRGVLNDDSENEENVGLGVRRLLWGECLIVGGNIFYDTRESPNDFRYEQLGLGLEILTDWVDARANYYLPDDDGDRHVIESQDTQESSTSITTAYSDPFFTENEVRQTKTQTETTTITSHHFDRFEEALEGVDFEIGFKIPWISRIAETRIFGGYYYYNSNFYDDLSGFKSRLEVRAVPAVIFDAEWYQDKELHGSDYFVGVRCRLPFDIGNLFQRKNPFEGARDYFKRGPQSLKSRMTDMVMRDTDIILEESDFIEDQTQLKVETTVEVNVYNITLLDDITFVDGDNDGEENGTFENPYDTIQEGVDAAFGAKLVYVGFAEDYLENVKLSEGVTLWGSGCVIFGIEDGINGVRPTVNGQSLGPAIEMADNSSVWGFHVINQDLGGPAQMRTVADQTYDISRVGIYAENKTNLEVSCNNLLEANSTSILFASDTVSDFSAAIFDNTFQFNDNGIKIFGKGSSGTSSTLIENNTIQSSGVGVEFMTKNYDDFSAVIQNNILTGNSQGINVVGDSNVSTYVQINDNDVDDNTGTNIEANLTANNGPIELYVYRNEASNSLNLLGILLDAEVNGAGNIFAVIQDNVANNNVFENIKIDLETDSGSIEAYVDANQASNSTGSIGILLSAITHSGGPIDAFVQNSIANANAGFANIMVDLEASGNDILVSLDNTQASDGASLGLLLNAKTLGTGDILTTISNNISNRNVNENIKLDLDTDTGGILGTIIDNQASESSSNIGINVDSNISVTGTNIIAISGNDADSNAGFANIRAHLETGTGNIVPIIDSNQASNGATLGILLEGFVNVAGSFVVGVTDNIADGNASENIKIDLDAIGQDSFVAVYNNQSSDSTTSMGLSVSAGIAGGAGDLDVLISANVANNNFSDNIFGSFATNNGNFGIEVADNEASASAGSSGINLSGVVGGGTGSVTADILNNTADGNDSTNIFGSFLSQNSYIILTAEDNAANGSANSSGIDLSGVVGSGTGAIVADILNNTANGNDSFNIFGSFVSQNSSIILTAEGNAASGSADSGGISLSGVVGSGTGGIVVDILNNTADGNDSTNIFGSFVSQDSNIILTAEDNAASGSTNSSGISLSGVVGSGTGGVTADILNNTADGNDSFNIFGSFVSQNSNIIVTAQDNSASGSLTDMGISLSGVVGSGTGGISGDISNNTANGNEISNIFGSFVSQNSNINLLIQDNSASGGFEEGLIFSGIVASGTGSVTVDVLNNIADGNEGTNFFGSFISQNSNINLTVQDNQLSTSTFQSGISLSGVVGTGTGGITADILNNTADGNSMDNIFASFVSLNSDINAALEDNAASGSLTGNGISLSGVVGSGTGGIVADILNNTADGNDGINILGNFTSQNSDINLTVEDNDASGSLTNMGISLSGVVGSGIGGINADISDNTANDNVLQNMFIDLHATNDISMTVSNNQANSGNSLGIEANALIDAGGTGDVTASFTGNTASENANENIKVSLESRDGNINLTYNLNVTDSSAVGVGSSLNASVVSGNGGITAQINNNTASNNNATNLFAGLSSNNGDIDFELQGNTADNSATGFGFQLPLTVNGSGNINALMVSNTALSNSSLGFIPELKAAGDVALTLTSNVANDNGANGFEIKINEGAVVGTNVDVYGEDNVARTNASDGIRLYIDSGSASYDIDFGGGALASPGNNSMTDNSGFDFHDVSPVLGGPTLFAQSNYWVDTTPDLGDEYQSDGANSIDVTNALVSDPNP